MQRLKTTFKRSRTPTGAEMKTQSSLEVPKQIRSVSFDEIQFESKRLHNSCDRGDAGLLSVPQFQEQRSHSIDACGSEEAGNFLEVPTRHFQRRRSSGSKSPACVHCACVEEYARLHPPEDASSEAQEQEQQRIPQLSFSISDSSSECDEEAVTECTIKVTLSPTDPPVSRSPPPPALPPLALPSPFPDDSLPPCDMPSPSTPTRRKSIHRQEAFFAEPTGSSLENISDGPSEVCSEGIVSDGASEGALSEGDLATTTVPGGLVVRDIYLKVPDLKRDRAASVDSSFSKVSEKKTEELQHSNINLEVPVGSNVALRSRSVDIVLPTDEQARYKALTMAAPHDNTEKERETAIVGDRTIRSTPDWNESAVNGGHLWVLTSVSGDFCYVGDSDCTKHGSRMKCSACNVVAHQNCIDTLMNKMRFTCKPTFRDVGVRQYREQTSIQHHWVHRRSEKGKCRQCGKAFQSKLSFSSKEIVAISCSWCKVAFHNKESCFNIQRMSEECDLGVHKCIIVPPSWIVKLPRKGSFKSSLRKPPKKGSSCKKRTKDKDKEQRMFAIKPIPSANVTPVIVFINPRSGGNQGAKLLQKFQWLLNPRQVFDLTQGGPRMGLELFKKVPNLRVLACGGDGTVGWVLSVIDQIGISPAPAVGVLPLGTGNDLARALGWGGGYTDEPVSKILSNISASDTVFLDRWSLNIERNTNSENDGGKENLPLNVVNNYYSLGVDAHIALEFHEAREAHPEKFNSRLRNKMFYGQMGGKDLLKRKWKDLADFVTLECDGKELTPKLKELKVHAIVFLNIPSYGGGTRPWNKSMGSAEPSTEDGLIEVVGLTTYQLPLLQAGGHGTSITQCKSAKIVTSKTIPMQVDGEACRLAPSLITLSLLNKAPMLVKRKCGKFPAPQAALDNLKVCLNSIKMADYDQYHYDKDLLVQAANSFGTFEVNPVSDLEQVRVLVQKFIEENTDQNVSSDWCFLDSCTAERFFRIDKAQENLHYISDIATNNLYILDCGGETVPQTPEDETAVASPSSNNQTYMVPEMRIIDDGSLDSPSDQPPLSPRALQPPTIPLEEQNGAKQIECAHPDTNLNIRRSPAYIPSEALLRAGKVGDLRTVRDLHNQGCSLLSTDDTGQTALHYACHYGHKDVVRYLLRCAPSSILNIQDTSSRHTALHKAVLYKWKSICCMLVACGAALDITDSRGLTPRLLALQSNEHELATYLEGQEHFQSLSSTLGTAV